LKFSNNFWIGRLKARNGKKKPDIAAGLLHR